MPATTSASGPDDRRPAWRNVNRAARPRLRRCRIVVPVIPLNIFASFLRPDELNDKMTIAAGSTSKAQGPGRSSQNGGRPRNGTSSAGTGRQRGLIPPLTGFATCLCQRVAGANHDVSCRHRRARGKGGRKEFTTRRPLVT